jgi:hypothetical protein
MTQGFLLSAPGEFMLGSLRRFGATALAAALALASCGAPAMAVQSKVMHVPAKASKPGKRGLFNDLVLPTTASRYGRKGAGITMAQQQRSAAKKRSVARNRRHHR